MRYLYGDSSAFPLNENFIETLAAATDCAVALLDVEEKIERARQTADEVNSAAMRELADIDQLENRVTMALAQREHLSEATAKVARAVAEDAKAQFDRARGGVRAWCETTIRASAEGCGPADVVAPLHRFMLHHQLPYTSWGLRWRAGRAEERTQAQVYAIMQRGLTATLAVAIPPKHFWAQPVRVGQLEKDVAIQLVGRGWLGGEKLRGERLDKLFVTRITRTSDKHAFVLNKKAKDPSPGLRFQLRQGEVKRVTVQRIDAHDQPIGDPATLEGVDANKVKRVWRRIEETIGDLVQHRAQLLAATLYGKRVTELETPAVIAAAIIQAVAPLARDMARHSGTPGELQLKRDLGDGRREELFLGVAELSKKYAHLSPRTRDLFGVFGLDGLRVSGVVPRGSAIEAPMLPPPPGLPAELAHEAAPSAPRSAAAQLAAPDQLYAQLQEPESEPVHASVERALDRRSPKSPWADRQLVAGQWVERRLVEGQVIDRQVVATQVIDREVVEAQLVDAPPVQGQLIDGQVDAERVHAQRLDAVPSFAVVHPSSAAEPPPPVRAGRRPSSIPAPQPPRRRAEAPAGFRLPPPSVPAPRRALRAANG